MNVSLYSVLLFRTFTLTTMAASRHRRMDESYHLLLFFHTNRLPLFQNCILKREGGSTSPPLAYRFRDQANFCHFCSGSSFLNLLQHLFQFPQPGPQKPDLPLQKSPVRHPGSSEIRVTPGGPPPPRAGRVKTAIWPGITCKAPAITTPATAAPPEPPGYTCTKTKTSGHNKTPPY